MQQNTVVAKLKESIVKDVTKAFEEKAVSVPENTRESMQTDRFAGVKVMMICGVAYIIYKNSPHIAQWWTNLQFEAAKRSKDI